MSKLIKVVFDDEKEIGIELERTELIYGIEGVFYDIDSKFAYIPIIDKKVPVFKSDENRFFIPAHIEKDWNYAKSNNIEIKQVVAPYFFGEGEETVRDDVETQIRHSVIAIIKHDTEEKYLCVDAKGRDCKSFVLGGIEKNETPEEAAIREVKEETGYTDIKINYRSPITLINHFYAGYKGINRYATLDIIFGNLESEENIGISEKENQKHVVKWIKKEDLKDFISINNNKYALDILLNGDKAFTGEGIIINSNDEINNLKTTKARKVIENKLLNC